MKWWRSWTLKVILPPELCDQARPQIVDSNASHEWWEEQAFSLFVQYCFVAVRLFVPLSFFFVPWIKLKEQYYHIIYNTIIFITTLSKQSSRSSTVASRDACSYHRYRASCASLRSGHGLAIIIPTARLKTVGSVRLRTKSIKLVRVSAQVAWQWRNGFRR